MTGKILTLKELRVTSCSIYEAYSFVSLILLVIREGGVCTVFLSYLLVALFTDSEFFILFNCISIILVSNIQLICQTLVSKSMNSRLSLFCYNKLM